MERSATDAGDLQHCHALLARGSRSFSAASWLLPAALRDDAAVYYAFCRVADDAVDLSPGQEPAAIDALDRRLDGVYGDVPRSDPIDRALRSLVRRRRVPRALLQALLEGFAWDAGRRRYETIEQLHDYGARVAGSVGATMTLLMGVRDEETLARATDLGVAMQLTNIARDVGEDLRAGRLYLPLGWLREEGLEPDALLAAPAHSAALGRVVGRLLAEADRLYLRSDAGVARLPWACRPAIRAARRIYAAIGDVLAARSWDAVSARASTSAARKLWLLLRSLPAVFARPASGGPAVLPANAHLLVAVRRLDAAAGDDPATAPATGAQARPETVAP